MRPARRLHTLHLIAAVPCCLLGGATTAASQRPSSPAGATVLVSRREARVTFARDTSTTWGWSDRTDPRYIATYVWAMRVNGMDGLRSVMARVDRIDSSARAFPSLAALVHEARATRCAGSTIVPCIDSATSARVDDDRVVLTLRDSTAIARLFGLRPAFVEVAEFRPNDTDAERSDSVRVTYIDPQIPMPDANVLADAARSRRRYETSIHSVARYIAGGTETFAPLWLQVGDSTVVRILEDHCQYDACFAEYPALDDSGWSVRDPAIARVGPVPAPRDTDPNIQTIFTTDDRARLVSALRVGRTVLRVHGVHGVSDTAASSRPVQHEITRAVIVTPVIARVAVAPRRDTVRVGQPFALRVHVIDRDGHEVDGVPARLAVLDGDLAQVDDATGPVTLRLDTPGRVRIVGRLGAHADTLTVVVVRPER